MKHVAIIGGGAAGSAVVGEILRQHGAADISITWLAGRRSFGRGVAYATSAEHHLLNVRAAGMDLFADDTGAFLRYAAVRGRGVKASDFVPRQWFGDFIEASLDALIAAARERGQRIEILRTEAVAIRGSDEIGYVVSTRDGDELHADAAVMAIGALPPQPLGEIEHDALCSGAYAFDAWQWPSSASSPRHIAVIGTGLTAIDTILQAASLWPDARISAISRHGRLPGTHLATPGQPYEHQAELIETMLAQPTARRWLHLLREAVDDGTTDWQSVVDGLRQSTPALWRALPTREKARFIRHLRGPWETHRHRLPPQTTEAIEALRAAGRLNIIVGRIVAIEGQAPLDIRLRNERAAENSLTADLVIQATGFNTSVTDTRHRLIRQLLDEGLVCADALGLGLAADEQGLLLRPDGMPSSGLRVIGTLLRGALWECSAFSEIRATARRIAGELRDHMAARDSAAGGLRSPARVPKAFASIR